MRHLDTADLLAALLSDPNGPQHVAFNRHPGGFKIKATYQDGQVKSTSFSDIDDLDDQAEDFLGSLIPPETSPEATPPSEAPEVQSPPQRTASGHSTPAAKASAPAGATPGKPSH